MKRFGLMLALPIVFAACWGDDSPTQHAPLPAPAPKPAGAPAPPPAPPQAAAPALGVWTWPTDYGEKRDLTADQRDCRGMIPTTDPPLTQYRKVWDCMEGRGWKRAVTAPQQPAAAIPIRELWNWAGSSSASPDLDSDSVACNSQKTPDAQPLVQVKQYMDCMTAKGWQADMAALQRHTTQKQN